MCNSFFSFVAGLLIIFEVQYRDETTPVKLNEITKTFLSPLTHEMYHLTGVTRRLPPPESAGSEIGHFTALCLRNHTWMEYDDNKSQAAKIQDTTSVLLTLFFYVKG